MNDIIQKMKNIQDKLTNTQEPINNKFSNISKTFLIACSVIFVYYLFSNIMSHLTQVIDMGIFLLYPTFVTIEQFSHKDDKKTGDDINNNRLQVHILLNTMFVAKIIINLFTIIPFTKYILFGINLLISFGGVVFQLPPSKLNELFNMIKSTVYNYVS